MLIQHRIDDFLYTLFPDIQKGDLDALQHALVDYYTYGPFKPKVSIDNDWIRIDIDTPAILSQEKDYRRVVQLCEKGEYKQAKPILTALIAQNPSNSEYHRILGQVLSDEGDQEEAINSLIDALRWDPRNGWALLMMGNIFAKFKDDVPTAMKYYDQALLVNPNDHITINNIGANLMQQGKLEEAKKYFWEAVRINGTYPNTHFALGMIAETEGDLNSAFYSTVKSILLNKQKDGLYQNAVRQAFEIAQRIAEGDQGTNTYKAFKEELETQGKRGIDILQDEEIPTAAKMEFAENYQRENHVIRYKSAYPVVEHLIMHELTHLHLVIEAREKNMNQLFISNQDHKAVFIRSIGKTLEKLKAAGVSDTALADYSTNLFDGMNRQIFNAPIDLFIEDFLYREYADIRPYQFLSVYKLLQEGVKSVTDKQIIELSPPEIVSKSKIYNLVNAMQFRELYGIDLIGAFKATPQELKTATDFYAEFQEYKDDKEPAEEYELVLHWAEDLKLDKLFELVDENNFRTKRSDAEALLESIEKDPFDMESKDAYKDRELEKFLRSQETMGLNMAVVMFMVEALQFFESMAKEEVKKIAFEIALQGTQGYRPDKSDYRISSVKGKTFSGYQILAYYYVSWAKAIPDMLGQLQLPYEEEYEMALRMYNEAQH